MYATLLWTSFHKYDVTRKCINRMCFIVMALFHSNTRRHYDKMPSETCNSVSSNLAAYKNTYLINKYFQASLFLNMVKFTSASCNRINEKCCKLLLIRMYDLTKRVFNMCLGLSTISKTSYFWSPSEHFFR